MSALSEAGRAARDVLDLAYRAFRRTEEFGGESPEPDEVDETLACAVLGSLGIEMSGWEWRVGWGEGTEGDWSGTFSTEDEARKHVAAWRATRLQRRPKFTVAWTDSEPVEGTVRT